jgi:hypothetical protein
MIHDYFCQRGIVSIAINMNMIQGEFMTFVRDRVAMIGGTYSLLLGYQP